MLTGPGGNSCGPGQKAQMRRAVSSLGKLKCGKGA